LIKRRVDRIADPTCHVVFNVHALVVGRFCEGLPPKTSVFCGTIEVRCASEAATRWDRFFIPPAHTTLHLLALASTPVRGMPHLNPGVEFISTPGLFFAIPLSPEKSVAVSRFPVTTCGECRVNIHRNLVDAIPRSWYR
jgi:hypothetical protein